MEPVLVKPCCWACGSYDEGSVAAHDENCNYLGFYVFSCPNMNYKIEETAKGQVNVFSFSCEAFQIKTELTP